MAYKTILVHLDSNPRCHERVSVATQWAKAHGSRLVGIVPTGLYDGVIRAEALAHAPPDFIAASADFLRERAERISREFRQRLGDEVPHEVRVVDEPAIDVVVRHARTSDLVIVGQVDREGPDDVSATRDLPQHVLMEAGCPVLAVPFAGDVGGTPRSAVIAWNGSREASVAVHAALPALALARSVSILAFGQSQEEANDELMLPQLCEFLRLHGVQADARREVSDIDIGDALLSRLSDLGADLLVMGGYGHSRLRELVLGGVTRRILGSMTVPVLMAH